MVKKRDLFILIPTSNVGPPPLHATAPQLRSARRDFDT